MSENSKEETLSQEFHNHNQLTANDEVAIMKKVGPNFGVTIQVLCKEGDAYGHEYIEYMRKSLWSRKLKPKSKFTDRVPKGKSFINISSKKPDLGNFWNAVRAEQAQQPPANLPKI